MVLCPKGIWINPVFDNSDQIAVRSFTFGCLPNATYEQSEDGDTELRQ